MGLTFKYGLRMGTFKLRRVVSENQKKVVRDLATPAVLVPSPEDELSQRREGKKSSTG